MQAFLDKTAQYLYKKWGDDMENICVVLPTRRAKLFLKKYLSRHAGKTIWSPGIFSIEDFVYSLSEFEIIDPVYLQFELYRIYLETEGDKAAEFSEFMKWGSVLLNDFNEIDKYLVDPANLFGYLTDVKAIELWNPGGKVLTPFQQNYLRFYKSLNSFYQKLADVLLKKRQAYPGLAYRKIAEQSEFYKSLQWKHVVFAGFNALTAAERKIIFTLINRGKAEIIWDADRYYVENEIHEAGRFIRKYLTKLNPAEVKWIDSDLSERKFQVNVVGVPQNVLQAKVAGNILAGFAANTNAITNTALVLNDESLLDPVLNSIPAGIDNFNITMGLSLKSTPLFQLIDSIFSLQVNILKLSNNHAPGKIYFRDLLRVLDHPYFSEANENKKFGKIAQTVRTSNKVFFSHDDIKKLPSDPVNGTTQLFEIIFKSWNDYPGKAIEGISSLIGYLKKKFSETGSPIRNNGNQSSLELEHLFHFSKVMQKLKKLVSEFPYITTIASLRELLRQLCDSVIIPFYGEPLQGLQIMGMLETQALDFENIIILSANEGCIPSGKSVNSFISFEIRCRFDLPTYKERNAVYAYHFYRLLQRTEKAFILYNTEHGELGGDEKSRFVTQLLYELPKHNPVIEIRDQILSLPVVSGKTSFQIVIPKNHNILVRLEELASTGLSASSLNIWRNCPLRFYFQYIASLKESEEPEETIEANTLGSAVHDVLRIFYEPLTNKILTAGDIEKMKPVIESSTRQAIIKYFNSGEIDFGKNLLITRVAIEYVKNFLDHEFAFLKSATIPVQILYVEKQIDYKAEIKGDKENRVIKLTGKIDRVDLTEGIIRIIDYKTGKVDQRNLRIDSWEELFAEPRLDIAFQLLFYSYLFSKSSDRIDHEIEPWIISFRGLKGGVLKLKLPDKEIFSMDTIMKFEDVLKAILSEIFDPLNDFRQTEVIENCNYCQFRSICSR